ncbi:MAG: HAD family phosphatase [Verrucomicrobiota bacterium]
MERSRLGIVFDWDGVVIDSHRQHEESFEMLAAELERPWEPAFFKRVFGVRNNELFPHLLHWAEAGDQERIQWLSDRKEALYRELVVRDGIEPLAGVCAFLDELEQAGIPTSVGTSTPRKNYEVIVEVLGLRGQFHQVTAAEDVTKGKPAPDVFLKAAEKIDRLPGNCVVIEDSHAGLEAGRAAGMKTVAVATTHPLASLQADLVVPDMTHVSLSAIEALFS